MSNGQLPEDYKDELVKTGIRAFNDGIRVERKRAIELLAKTICNDFKERNSCTHPTCLVLDFKVAEIKGAYGE